MRAATDVPVWQVPRLPWRTMSTASTTSLDPLAWCDLPPLPPLVRTEDGNPPLQGTTVRLGWSDEALFARFDCVDREPWATHRERDAPLWEEEVVELFLAPGERDPSEYFEIEVNPLGALFDARIANPRLDRSELRADLVFDWPAIRWEAGALGSAGWWAAIVLPWSGFAELAGRQSGAPSDTATRPVPFPPRHWRANLYRIDRPPRGDAEFSAWSPTLVTPADFHRPRRFGHLLLSD